MDDDDGIWIQFMQTLLVSCSRHTKDIMRDIYDLLSATRSGWKKVRLSLTTRREKNWNDLTHQHRSPLQLQLLLVTMMMMMMMMMMTTRCVRMFVQWKPNRAKTNTHSLFLYLLWTCNKILTAKQYILQMDTFPTSRTDTNGIWKKYHVCTALQTTYITHIQTIMIMATATMIKTAHPLGKAFWETSASRFALRSHASSNNGLSLFSIEG